MTSNNVLEFNPCVVIPVFNHSQFVLDVYRKIEGLNVFCFIINDGSKPEDTEYLRQTFSNMRYVKLVEQFPNQGKGAAVREGFKHAYDHGFTHVLQVDADGQHNIEDAGILFEAAKKSPGALVTGIPVYDESVPKTRLFSRYITHVWVWIETLSFEIKDSMCGFRVYPLVETLAAIDKTTANRMDFDTQVLVRLHWRGVRIISVPTKVVYPENGVSNFRLWRDNFQITKMHTKLVFGMLWRLPMLLLRKLRRAFNG